MSLRYPRVPVDVEREIRRAIARKTRRRGSAKQLAHELGLSHGHVLAIRSGRSSAGSKVAEAFGFRPVVVWERVKK